MREIVSFKFFPLFGTSAISIHERDEAFQYGKMEHCRSFQQSIVIASHEEMRGFTSILDPRDFIICPRPRRAGLSLFSSLRPMRCHMSHETEQCDSEAGLELLDHILTKKDSLMEPHHASEIASSPPFFSGSPPSRAGNPLTQDARFRNEGTNPITEFSVASPPGLPSPLLHGHKRCAKRRSGANPAGPVRLEGFNIIGRESKKTDITAAIRVEGFDILNRDRPNSGFPAAIRVDGFDILSVDGRNSSISAAA